MLAKVQLPALVQQTASHTCDAHAWHATARLIACLSGISCQAPETRKDSTFLSRSIGAAPVRMEVRAAVYVAIITRANAALKGRAQSEGRVGDERLRTEL